MALPLIAAGIGVAGSLGAGALAYKGQQNANVANARMAREQMDFQERMANTSWRRGVDDMKAAGLNPALAYQKGGADSPAGQTAAMQNELGAGVSSAQAQRDLQSRMETQKVERAHLGAQVDATSAQAEKTREEAANIRLLRDATHQELLERAHLHTASAYNAKNQGTATGMLWPVQRDEIQNRVEQARSRFPLEQEYLRAQTQHSVSSAFSQKMQARMLELMEPERQARANAVQNNRWYFENVAPFTSDATSALRAATPFLR